ncbi:uncharacterized protein J8A68_000393 [[Candida] subhashii]|uniref:Uncharacterized protein n=1 Tax=[Candida] subhashii TaxID=561895 RepID=A0A8J5US79_9ASCO|nr:uncharacterized protein J8A68_000393 [[Candida] subhashii]KAG7666136.1 hypothetical protein J8A68_000393 [[Candida] subhashii]
MKNYINDDFDLHVRGNIEGREQKLTNEREKFQSVGGKLDGYERIDVERVLITHSMNKKPIGIPSREIEINERQFIEDEKDPTSPFKQPQGEIYTFSDEECKEWLCAPS